MRGCVGRKPDDGAEAPPHKLLMGMTGDCFAQVVIIDGEFKAGSGIELAYVGAIELLPRRIVLQGRGWQSFAAGFDFFVAD